MYTVYYVMTMLTYVWMENFSVSVFTCLTNGNAINENVIPGTQHRLIQHMAQNDCTMRYLPLGRSGITGQQD